MRYDGLYHLSDLEEVVGTLDDLATNEGILTARVGRVTVVLPFEMEEELCPLIGQKIGILRIDGRYLHRVIQNGKSKGQELTSVSAEGLVEETCE